jgi:Skp family chaperone for outer membrane proteins
MEDQGTTPGVMETQLRAWGAELDRLKAKVEKDIAEARKEYYEHIEELRDDIAAQLKKWAREVETLEPTAGARTVLRELRGKIEAELARWEPEIEALRSKADRAEAEAKRLSDELKARRKAMKEKLSELRHASGAAWEDVKAGTTKAWEELKPALQSAISKFK